MGIKEMVSPEEARQLVLDNVSALNIVEVPLLEACGRVAAADLKSDIDITPFDHSAMDGYCMRAEQIQDASPDTPVVLNVVAEIPAGSFYDGDLLPHQCCRIMTGAALPDCADSVVKYEMVEPIEGDGREGSRVSFSAPVKTGNSVRFAGEEAKQGQVIVQAGEVVGTAGVGFLASCGVTMVPTYRRPKVAVIATGSELVDPGHKPGRGQIRNSNSYTMAAQAAACGAQATVLPICKDTFDDLKRAVSDAVKNYDFVITTGGAANGDYDFIKAVVSELGELKMSTVNMRPGKAQTFGVVNGTPVFGLPGNPAAAYCGFEMLIRPALRKMQGYTNFDRPRIRAKLSKDMTKKDPRRIYLRSTISKDADGDYVVEPAKNQSSGLFGVLQRSNCLAIMPEGNEGRTAGSVVECILLDVSEDVCL